MPRIGIIRQDQIRGSGGGDQRNNGYLDDFVLVESNAENVQNTILDDLNYLRTVVRTLHGNNNWWEAEQLSQGTFFTMEAVTESSYLSLGPVEIEDPVLSQMTEGLAVCLMTNDFTYGDVTSSVVGRIGVADSRKESTAENAPMFYSLLGIVTRSLGDDTYRVCTSGYSGMTNVYDPATGLLEKSIVAGQVYYLGTNGLLVTKEEAVAAVDTRRLQRVGYGAYSPSSATSPVLVVDIGEVLET